MCVCINVHTVSTVLSCYVGTCPHGALSAQTWAGRCCSSMVYSSRAPLSGRWVSMWGVLLRLRSVESSQPAPGISRLSRLITTDRSTVSPTRVFFSGTNAPSSSSFEKNKSDFFPPTQRQRSFFPHSRDLILELLDRTRFNLNEPADILLFLWILRFVPLFVPCTFPLESRRS